MNSADLINQIPHAFQQIMSHEKIPTLCRTLPAFYALTQKWEEYQEEHPETFDIVQKGLNKLDEYHDRADAVPAYVLAMGV